MLDEPRDVLALAPSGSASWIPVVSSSSPPDSHGVGSSSSVQCTQRTGASADASPAHSVSPDSASTSATVSISRCCTRSHASVRTGRRTASISSNCCGPAISGGESWMTGSPRSSARQIRPAPEQLAGDEAAQQVLGLRVVEALLRLAVLDELDRLEVARAADVADDRDVAQAVEHRAERGLVGAHVAAEVLALHDVDVRERDRGGDRVAAEREAVGEGGPCPA